MFANNVELMDNPNNEQLNDAFRIIFDEKAILDINNNDEVVRVIHVKFDFNYTGVQLGVSPVFILDRMLNCHFGHHHVQSNNLITYFESLDKYTEWHNMQEKSPLECCEGKCLPTLFGLRSFAPNNSINLLNTIDAFNKFIELFDDESSYPSNSPILK